MKKSCKKNGIWKKLEVLETFSENRKMEKHGEKRRNVNIVNKALNLVKNNCLRENR